MMMMMMKMQMIKHSSLIQENFEADKATTERIKRRAERCTLLIPLEQTVSIIFERASEQKEWWNMIDTTISVLEIIVILE